MKWKEFLKPDWKKPILTLIIFLIIPMPLYHPVSCEMGAICNPILTVSLAGFVVATNLLISSNYSYNFEIFWLFYIIILLVSYLLSCFIISKVKKK
jgi:hypothetical protein